MPGYAHVNLLELKDSVAGRTEGLEGRFGRGPMGHKHREQEEAYLVISGSGQILLDGEVSDLRQWDLVRVSPEVVRAFAAGPEGMEIVAVGGPKPEGGDGETEPLTWPE